MEALRPPWLKKRLSLSRNVGEVRTALKELEVNTVCQSSLCPNITECFSRKFATFLILGPACTRRCAFCGVSRSAAFAPDPGEPSRVADAVRRLKLRYALVTSVTRDDLPDGGAAQFARVIEMIRRVSTDIVIEVLVPDFRGRPEDIDLVISSRPHVIGHNIETVWRLYEAVRSGADYERSLDLLRRVKNIDSRIITKSGIMVGLGEREDEVIEAMRDLRGAGCWALTVGQYLAPSKEALPVERFVAPEEFSRYASAGMALGFRDVAAGPFVRSSYAAEEMYNTIISEATQ